MDSTLVTHSVTFASVYPFAHRLGSRPPSVGAAPDTPVGDWESALSQRLFALGKPLLLGLATLAITAAC